MASIEEQTQEFLEHFTNVYDEKGNEINPIPSDAKLTVFCEASNGDQWFHTDLFRKEIGLSIFIVKKWILQSDLDKLYEGGVIADE